MRSELQSELRPHLEVNESLLWAGKPKRGVFLQKADVFLIPFSLMWGGFAIFWEFSVITSNAPFFFQLWGVPFVLAGLYLIVGRFFFDAKRRAKTTYGITKDRIIIKSGVFSPTIKSINISTLREINLTEKNDKSGTIVLGANTVFVGMYRGSGRSRYGQLSPSLEMIDNVRAVYRQIIDLQKND